MHRVEDVPPAICSQRNYAAAAVARDGATEILIYRLKEHCDDEEPSPERSDEQVDELPFSDPLARIALVDCGGVCDLRWSISSDAKNGASERLVAVGPAKEFSLEEAGGSTASRGRIVLIDFSVPELPHEPETLVESIDIDLDIITDTETLPDQALGFEEEVDLVRRRTVAQRRTNSTNRGTPRTLNRAVTTAGSRRGGLAGVRNSDDRSRRDSSGHFNEDAQAALEEPYTQGAPRPQMSLQRAATVLAASPAARRHLRALPDRPLEYRRADGLREMPDESDADNWEPPPPPYSHSVGNPAPLVIAPIPIRPQPNLPMPRVPIRHGRAASRLAAPSTSSSFYQHGSHVHSSPNLTPQVSPHAPGGEPLHARQPAVNSTTAFRGSIGNRSLSDDIASRQRSPPHPPNTFRSMMSLPGGALSQPAPPAALQGRRAMAGEHSGRPKREKRGLRCAVM